MSNPTPKKEKKPKAPPKPKVEPKPIPVYDNKQRELRMVTIEGVGNYQVTYDNKVVYLGVSLDEAITKYNNSGIIKMVLPAKPERKKTPSKKKPATKASKKKDAQIEKPTSQE